MRGLFYGNGGQFLAQAAEAFSIIVFVFGFSLAFFKVLSAFKLLRSDPHDEIQGLDVPEMGSLGYNNVDIRMHGARLTPQVPHVLERKN